MTDLKEAPPKSPQYFIELESLRGIAALAVAAFHINWLSPIYHWGFIRNGYLMVDFFFVLSGFVMCHTYGNKIRCGLDIPWFMWLRFGRIYPLHLFMLLIFLGIETAKYIAINHFGISGGDSSPFSVNNIPSFIKNLLLIHGLGTDHSSFNFPSWSISTEFFVYLIFSAVSTILNKSRTKAITISFIMIFVSTAVILVAGKNNLFFTMDFGIMRCIMGFFWGVLAYQAFSFVKQQHSTTTGSICRLFSPLLLLATLLFIATKSMGYSDYLLPPLTAVLIFSLTVYPNHTLTRFLSWSPIARLGQISYSIYMVHAAVLWVCGQLLLIIFHQKQYADVLVGSDKFSVLNPEPRLAILMTAAAISLILVISCFTYHKIEEPFRRLTKHLATKWFHARASFPPQKKLVTEWKL